MKIAVFFSCFVFFVACQAPQTPPTQNVVAKDTSLGPYIEKIKIYSKDTILGYHTQYTKIKHGKELALAKRCALHYLTERHEVLNAESRPHYNYLVAKIMDQTCGIRDNERYATPFLDFDRMNGKVYFTYVTEAGWDIPIEEVEAYLE